MTMKHARFLLMACLALIGFSMRTAKADDWNKKMVLQFHEPVQVPGKVLQPGKYVFLLAESSSNRSIVEVFAVDEKGRQNFVTTIMAVPDFRLDTPDKPIVQLSERHLGDPETIKSWFYPGDNYGWEFVYPKSERLETASVAVPPAEPAFLPPAPPVEEPAVSEPAVEAIETTPVEVSETETLIAEVESAPDPNDDALPGADRELPETAGHFAAFWLAGFLIIGGGLLTLFLRRVQPQATL